MAITREEVLHVARLARLELSDDEVTRFQEQLSAILEAVSKVSELDLSDVPPTSHPLEIANAWAEDEPHVPASTSFATPRPRRPVPQRARDRDGTDHLPATPPRAACAPGTWRHVCALRPARGARIDTLAHAGGARTRAAPSGGELWDAYRAAIDAGDGELHAFLTLADERDGDGVPIALKDVISTKGIRTTAGSKILENYVPVFDATVAARCRAAGMPRARQDEHRRVRDGLVDRELRLRPDPQPVGSDAAFPAARAAARRPRSPAGLAPWALGSDTGGSVKLPSAFCGNVGLRPTYGTVSRYGVVAFASSLDQVGPVSRNVRDNALLYRIISGLDEHDSTTVDVPPVVLPGGRRPEGRADRRAARSSTRSRGSSPA